VSEQDVMGDAIERLEWAERDEEPNPVKSFRQFTRRTALTGSAAGLAA
jgi:simple sugar transport system substrate-binding protein